MVSRHPTPLKFDHEHRVENGDERDGDDEADDERVDDVDACWGTSSTVTCRYVDRTTAPSSGKTIFNTISK